MKEYNIPGHKTLTLKHLVLDYNGTLAVDGQLVDGVAVCLEALSKDLEIHVVTADTFGKAASGMKGIPCKVSILPGENQDKGKLDYITRLGPEHTACIGNGQNDGLMLGAAALGIAAILQEGAAVFTLTSADVVCTSIVAALELLLNPLRLTATLRC
jgi:soluble P-type ATPase